MVCPARRPRPVPRPRAGAADGRPVRRHRGRPGRQPSPRCTSDSRRTLDRARQPGQRRLPAAAFRPTPRTAAPGRGRHLALRQPGRMHAGRRTAPLITAEARTGRSSGASIPVYLRGANREVSLTDPTSSRSCPTTACGRPGWRRGRPAARCAPHRPAARSRRRDAVRLHRLGRAHLDVTALCRLLTVSRSGPGPDRADPRRLQQQPRGLRRPPGARRAEGPRSARRRQAGRSADVRTAELVGSGADAHRLSGRSDAAATA